MSDETSRRIGDYEVLGVLGSGGMGKVFKVRNVISERIEAMKILLPDLAGRQDLADRFLREIKLLATLNHPNIAALRTALTLNNQLVMVMEYVEGMTLAARLEQGPIPLADTLNYIDQTLGALSYAHQQHVIHRDIKPGNMMLTPPGIVKLMDFGIARSGTDRGLTTTGTTMGSLYYMSPEQVKGEATDARSDLYSLGVSLYEMVTGQRPFRSDSDFSLMAAHLEQTPKPPIELKSDLPAALNEIILISIAKDPPKRFQSADAFRNALNSVRKTLPTANAIKQNPSGPSPVGATAAFRSGVPIQSAAPGPFANDSTTAPIETLSQLPAQSPQVPSVLELSPKPGHRGLYMTLGASIVLVVLVAAGIYVPRRLKTSANERENAAQQGTPATSPPGSNNGETIKSQAGDSTGAPPQSADGASSSPNPTPTEMPTQGGTGNNATNPGDNAISPTLKQDETSPLPDGAQPKKKRVPSTSPGNKPSIGGGSQGTVDGRVSKTPPLNSAELEELEQQVDRLNSRANSASDSLDNLRRQQNAQGLGLRGDIASTQELMKAHLARAQTALQNQDASNAQKYSALAEQDVEKLEQFLGR
jgi:serine/threonine protein kinase